VPPAADVVEQPLVLDPWCWAALLWGHLYLLPQLPHCHHLEQAAPAAPGGAAYALVRTTMLGRYVPSASRFYTVERLAALLAALPPAWVHAARAAAAELLAGLLQTTCAC
jgi:hypothetical protein